MRLAYILVISMAISLIWGLLVFAMGIMVRFMFGSLINEYIGDAASKDDLPGAISTEGQNILPITQAVPDGVDIGEWAVTLGSLTVACGALIIIFSITGFIGALKYIKLLLAVTIIILAVTVGLELYLFQILNNETTSFHDDVRGQLLTKIQNEYKIESDGTTFTLLMNMIMLMNECCGINGPSDFNNLTYIERNNPNGATIFKIPPACCKKSIIVRGTGAAKAYEVLKQCAREGGDHAENINSRGCYTEVYHHIFSTHGQWMMALLLVIAIWSLMQMILSIITMMSPPPKPPERRRSTRTGSMARARSMSQSQPSAAAHKPVVPVKKAFVPLSKISSFDHPDPMRIKSTEIW